MKTYQPSTRRILHEARQEYAALLDGPGYSREQAVADFLDAQEAISQYLIDNSPLQLFDYEPTKHNQPNPNHPPKRRPSHRRQR